MFKRSRSVRAFMDHIRCTSIVAELLAQMSTLLSSEILISRVTLRHRTGVQCLVLHPVRILTWTGLFIGETTDVIRGQKQADVCKGTMAMRSTGHTRRLTEASLRLL